MKTEEIMKEISDIRKNKKITQECLATEIGKSTKFIGDIEIGRRRPSLQTFIDICEYLKIDVNSILYRRDKNE